MEFKGKEYMGDITKKLTDAFQNERKEIFMEASMIGMSTEVGPPFYCRSDICFK